MQSFNTRLVFDKTANEVSLDSPLKRLGNATEVETPQQLDYYPFGLQQQGVRMFRSLQEPKNRYRFNGIEHEEELGLDLAFYRSYDPAIVRWLQVDPAAEKYYSMSGYNGMGNNPISNSGFLGDTLTGVNGISAQRALEIIQNSFGAGSSGQAMAALFSLSGDGKTFNGINGNDFLNALGGLSTEQAALAIGYFQSVNSSSVNVVEVVKRNESLSEYGQERTGSSTGADLDFNSGGGQHAQATNYGNWEGDYAAIVMDSKAGVSGYSDGQSRASLPGELLSHELLGHGPGGRSSFTDGSGEAVQAGNLYLRATNRGYYRKDHGVARIPQPFNPNGIPSYLSPLRPMNFFPK